MKNINFRLLVEIVIIAIFCIKCDLLIVDRNNLREVISAQKEEIEQRRYTCDSLVLNDFVRNLREGRDAE